MRPIGRELTIVERLCVAVAADKRKRPGAREMMAVVDILDEVEKGLAAAGQHEAAAALYRAMWARCPNVEEQEKRKYALEKLTPEERTLLGYE